jgi:putative Holliday junction resolvase
MSVLGQKKPEQSAASISSPPRVLAIDYGHKRIGLALSDELGLTAQPLAVLIRKNRLTDMKRLREICKLHSVRRIIVGLPVHMTGQRSEMADEASRFAARLTKMLKIETEMVDERLTSWEARQAISEASGRSATKRAAVDDVAAAVLLRDYLEHRRETATSSAERV